jgi:membrane-associated phospholipid phosphatase
MSVASHQAVKQRNVRAASLKGSLGLVIGILLVIELAVIFVRYSDEVVEREYSGFDTTVALAVHSTATTLQTDIMLQVTNFGTYYLAALVILTLIIGAVRVWRVQRDQHMAPTVAIIEALAPAVAGGGALVLDLIVKQIVGRQRPAIFPPIVHDTGYSFPSGHTIVSVAFYGMCAYLLARSAPAWGRVLLTLAASVMIGAVAYSRVYLGAHYPTDVIGSFILGLAWLLTLLLTLTQVEMHLRRAHVAQKNADIAATAPPDAAQAMPTPTHNPSSVQYVPPDAAGSESAGG